MRLAEAILDQLLKGGIHYVLRGRSYWIRHHKEEVTAPEESLRD